MTGKENHRFFSLMEDVGKTKTCGIQSVVVCSPDIKTENENSQVEQVQADHNLEDIVSADKDRGNSTEEKHQGISDKESHNRGEAPAFPSFAKRAKFGVAVPPETKEPTPNHPICVKLVMADGR